VDPSVTGPRQGTRYQPRPNTLPARLSPRPRPQSGRKERPPRVRLGERLRDLLLVVLTFAVGGALVLGYTTFRVWQVGQGDGRRHVDAIVVLGAAQYNGRPSDALAARLDHAIDLYKAGYADYLITTGGNLPGDWTTEAEVGRRYAIKRAVPASAILIENTGHSTLDSIKHVRAILDAHGLKTALFVSDRSHMLRVLRLAADQGIEAWSSPTDTSPDDIDPKLWQKSMVHEVGAISYYMIMTGDPDSNAGAAGPASSASSASSASPSPSAR
jgi:uncharacterized SAM-binding protein YcdF (DUF218 family)